MRIKRPRHGSKDWDLYADMMEAEIDRLHRLFCWLTPGGSEFANDPDACFRFAEKTKLDMIEAKKDNVKLKRKLREVQNVC